MKYIIMTKSHIASEKPQLFTIDTEKTSSNELMIHLKNGDSLIRIMSENDTIDADPLGLVSSGIWEALNCL